MVTLAGAEEDEGTGKKAGPGASLLHSWKTLTVKCLQGARAEGAQRTRARAHPLPGSTRSVARALQVSVNQRLQASQPGTQRGVLGRALPFRVEDRSGEEKPRLASVSRGHRTNVHSS